MGSVYIFHFEKLPKPKVRFSSFRSLENSIKLQPEIRSDPLTNALCISENTELAITSNELKERSEKKNGKFDKNYELRERGEWY